MNTWQIILLIIGVLLAASWATAIPVALALWSKLLKLKADYQAAIADGAITDAERILLADDLMQCITDAGNLFQFLTNLIFAIINVINSGKTRLARWKQQNK